MVISPRKVTKKSRCAGHRNRPGVTKAHGRLPPTDGLPFVSSAGAVRNAAGACAVPAPAATNGGPAGTVAWRLTGNPKRLTGFSVALAVLRVRRGVEAGCPVRSPCVVSGGRDAVPASPFAGSGLAGVWGGGVCQSFTFSFVAFDSFCRRSRAVTT